MVLDAAMVGGNGLLHVAAQVVPHVPPVGNLPGIGRALPAAQREAAGPVPADQPDTRMSAEPPGEGAGLPVGRMSMMRWVSMSSRTLAYDWPRRLAQSSMPSTAVDPCRRLAALRTGHRRRARARHEPDQIAKVLHLVQLQAAQVGEQRVSQAGFLSGQLMPHNRPPRPLR
jgi:hypothetical protein